MCVVEFSGLHSDFLVCKLQVYTINFTVLFCKCVYSFSVNHSCQNYFVKTIEFILQCSRGDILLIIYYNTR